MATILDKIKDFFSKPIDDASIQEPSEEAVPTQEVIPEEVIPEEVVPGKEPVTLPEFEDMDPYASYEFDPIHGEVNIIRYTPDEPFPRMGEPGVDHSLVTLKYLMSIGYKECTWYLNDTHNWFSHKDSTGVDPCEQYHAQSFNMSELLNHAQSANVSDSGKVMYNPPSPIYAMSHPDCICELFCIHPLDPNDIPDNAPGMPLHATPELKQDYKNRIWDNILSEPGGGIPIYAWTRPPKTYLEEANVDWGAGNVFDEDSYTADLSSKLYRSKQALKNWEQSIIPIKIKDDFYIHHPIGLVQPIMKDTIGFILEINNNLAKVYLSEYNGVFYLPIDKCQNLELQISDTPMENLRGNFIQSNDMFGVIFSELSDNKVVAYFPDLEELATTTDFKNMQSV